MSVNVLTPKILVTVDRGVSGVGVDTITVDEVDSIYYLNVLYTNGTNELIAIPPLTEASVSATQAAASASASATSASNSATSAANSLASELASLASQLASASLYDQFDDRYLGAKATDPTVDNDGNAIINGALYFDTTLNVTKVYDLANTVWVRTVPTTVDQTNINTVSDNIASVNTVSGISTNVTTVATNNTNVTTVATNIASVNTVAGISSDVTTVSANIVDIQNAEENADSASLSASSATASASSATASASAASASATSASGSATTATTQAGIATAQASTATTQAGIATTQAGISTTQAGIATTKAAEALASATSAANSYDQFDDRYLGSKTTAPTVDNDGQPLLTGALYFNSVSSNMNVWDGSAWYAAYISVDGYAPLANPAFTGEVTENGYQIVSQSDIGTAPNEIPLNQYLGSLAYQDSNSVVIEGGVATLDVATITAIQNDTDISNVQPSLNLDFANTKKLDPRITYARASEATYYDGKTVSKAEENLLLYSQEFDNSYWTKLNCSVTANTDVAPDGTTTSETVTSSSTSFPFLYKSAYPIVSGNVYTLSVYAKAGTVGYLILNVGKPADSYVWFNLSTGAVGTQTGATGTSVSVGNGWYRFSATATATASANANMAVCLSDVDGAQTIAAGKTALIWGAQLEQRSAVSSYTPTTSQPITNYQPTLLTASNNVARFDHDPVTNESLGLLIEEQRTNLLTYSEDFGNASWSKTNSTITANAIVAPDGTLTGDKLVEAIGTVAPQVSRTISLTSGASYTLSFYAKRGERISCQVYWNNNGIVGNPFVNYDLLNGTATVGATGATATITNLGNDIYRCTATYTAAITGGQTTIILVTESPAAAKAATYTGDGYSGIYIWGAQLEAGAFPTSYIPTVASQVTRSADSASMTGANFSSWYAQTGGTIYIDAKKSPNTTNGRYFNLVGVTSTNRLSVYQTTSYAISFVSRDSVVQVSSSNLTTDFDNVKIAMAFTVNDFATTINGDTVVADTSGLLPDNLSTLFIGKYAYSDTANSSNTTIKKLSYFPARLSNEELIEMTS